MTPKMIAYLVLVLGLALGVLKVFDWRGDSLELRELKPKYAAERNCGEGSTCERKRIEARADAITAAQQMFADQVKLNEETDRAMQARLEAADRRYLDAADRLGRLRVCPAAAVPGHAPAATAGESQSAGAQPGGDGASAAGLGPILRGCELDAGQIAEFQQWYASLRASRESPHGRE